MPKDTKQKRWINKLLRNFESHVRADEVRGAARPEEMEIIHLHYKAARLHIFNQIKELDDLAGREYKE